MKGFMLFELTLSVLFLSVFLLVFGSLYPHLVEKGKQLRVLQNKKLELSFLKRSLCVLGNYNGPLALELVSENETQKTYQIEGLFAKKEVLVCQKQ